jgi:hypothetical protein
MTVGRLALHPAVTRIAPKYCTPAELVQTKRHRPTMHIKVLKYRTRYRRRSLSLNQPSTNMRIMAMIYGGVLRPWVWVVENPISVLRMTGRK